MIRTNYSTTKERQEALAPLHLKQASKIAWSYHRTTGIPFDDLQAEAYYAICRNVKRFDPKKARLSTLVHYGVHNRLRKFSAGHKRIPQMDSDEGLSHSNCPAKRHEFLDSLRSLGREASLIVQIIFEGPGEVLGIAADSGKRAIKKAIRQHMISEGFSSQEIRDGMEEIKELIQ